MEKTLLQNQLLDEMNVLIFSLETDMTIIYANKSLLEFSNVSLEDIKGIPAWELPMWQNNLELQNNVMFTLGHVFSSEESTRMEAITVNHDGHLIELDLQIKPIIENGQVINIMVIGYNITELVQAKKFLTKRERQIGAFFEYSTQGYFFQMLPGEALIPELVTEEFVNQIYDAQRVESINAQVFEYIGLDPSLENTENHEIISKLGITNQERICIWIEMINKGISSRKVEII
ncbi:MAG: PAS domain S-box protein, partial [Acidaminobacteraceae bacterium]